MPTPGYIFKDSGTTPPAADGNAENKFPQEPVQLGSQASSQLNPHTYAQFGLEPNAQHIQTTAQTDQPVTPNTVPSNSQPLSPETITFTTNPTLKDKASAVVQDSTQTLRKNFAADSHELAYEDHDIKGAVQTHRIGESNGVVTDIGWHKPPVEIPDPLIGGLTNGRLWSLIRRFNKDVFDVRAVPPQITSGLDLNEAWSDDHTTDKLPLHLRRAYLTIVLSMASLLKQVSRLRSWKETRRTAAFCLAYFSAWLVDLLIPLVLGTLIVLIASERARNVLFPPAPRALVNIKTGGLQKPQAGELGTSDSLTGALEKQEGEAVEEEAANFIDNIRHVVMRAVGMHDNQDRDGDPLEGKIPKPVRKAVKAIKTEGSAPGHATNETDQTQKPMEETIWSAAKPENLEPVVKTAPHIVGEIVDNWERFANAISPISPFSQFSFIRIDGVLIPLFLMSFFVSYYMVYKGTGFAIGFGIFGDPILTPSLRWINRNFPNWMELLEPKNNILRGVPTNNQITLTLLRIGEAHNTPLPPVPSSKPGDPDHFEPIDVDDIPLDATRAEVVNTIEPSNMDKAHPQGESKESTENDPKHRHLSKFVRIFKGNTKAVVETKLAIDHVRAAAGSEKAKGHLGILPKPKNLIYAGPSEFKARFEGKPGWLIIDESASPSLLFTTHDPKPNKRQNLEATLKIAVRNITRLKRATAFMSKPAEVAADWSTDKLLGSVEIDDQSKKTWRFTALPERDELFNRLIAIGDHRWENM